MRTLIIAAALAAGIASPALACSRVVPVQQGETEHQAWQRARRASQDERFRDSASVFVANVVEMKRTGAGRDLGLEIAIQPIIAVKGTMPEGVIRYAMDFKGTGCGDWDFPSIYEPGLFFADSGPSVNGMISIRRLEDQALRDRLFEQIDSAPPPIEVKPSALEVLLSRQISDVWPWIGVGLLVSLVIGLVMGAASRPGRDKQRKNP